MRSDAIAKLFRFRPTAAWAVCGMILGVSIAIHEYGFNIDWFTVISAFIPVVLIQGLLAHAVNDLSDEKVDRITDIKGTNRFKVLISGIMSREELIIISILVIALSLAVAWNIYTKLGFYILIFYAIGLYAPLSYSLPPLKLGWRPFSEWTVVFPSLITLVVASDFVASKHLSWLALAAGIIFALFNIVWFIISRMMDYEPDKKIGKITTIVKYGMKSDYCFDISLITFLVSFTFSYINHIFLTSAIICFAFVIILPTSFIVYYPSVISYYRKLGIYISIANSLILSIAFIVFR